MWLRQFQRFEGDDEKRKQNYHFRADVLPLVRPPSALRGRRAQVDWDRGKQNFC